MENEKSLREALVDFLLGVLDLSPETRWTPRQALQHPFITGGIFDVSHPPCRRPPASQASSGAQGRDRRPAVSGVITLQRPPLAAGSAMALKGRLSLSACRSVTA